MSVAMIGPEAEAHLNWLTLCEALEAGHRLPAAEIALLLGYSEPSVFFRAFRQWTGLTPGEYRAQQKAQ